MALRSEAIQRWWPTTQSLDLALGSVETVAMAVETEYRRFVGDEQITTDWRRLPTIDDAFDAAPDATSASVCAFATAARAAAHALGLAVRKQASIASSRAVLVIDHEVSVVAIRTVNRILRAQAQ